MQQISSPKEYDFIKGETLFINKPYSWTSFNVVSSIRYFLKHHYNIKRIKVGHAGTLDPLATGLLIICTGKKHKKKLKNIKVLKKNIQALLLLELLPLLTTRKQNQTKLFL